MSALDLPQIFHEIKSERGSYETPDTREQIRLSCTFSSKWILPRIFARHLRLWLVASHKQA